MSDVPAVLVANGAVRWTPALVELAAAGRPLVAADGGANRLAEVGLRPAAVVGDLDSIRPGVRRFVGEERVVERPDQDRTDLDKALEWLLDERRVPATAVLGWAGDRVDHTVGNLGLLARRALGPALRYVGDGEELLGCAGEVRLPAVPGETWSFWTFDPAVRVSLAGVRWPVERAALDLPGRPSISNLAVADAVEVRAEGGVVLVCRRLAGA